MSIVTVNLGDDMSYMAISGDHGRREVLCFVVDPIGWYWRRNTKVHWVGWRVCLEEERGTRLRSQV